MENAEDTERQGGIRGWRKEKVSTKSRHASASRLVFVTCKCCCCCCCCCAWDAFGKAGMQGTMFDSTRAPQLVAPWYVPQIVSKFTLRFSSIEIWTRRARTDSYLAARRKPWRNMQRGKHLCSWRRKSWEERYSWRIWGWSWWARWWPRDPPWPVWLPGSARSSPKRWRRLRKKECRSVWGSIPLTSQIVSHRQDENSFLKGFRKQWNLLSPWFMIHLNANLGL